MSSQTDPSSDKEEETNDHGDQLEKIRKKLKTSHPNKQTFVPKSHLNVEGDDDDNDLKEYYLHKDKDLEKQQQM